MGTHLVREIDSSVTGCDEVDPVIYHGTSGNRESNEEVVTFQEFDVCENS